MSAVDVVGWTIYSIMCYGTLLALVWFTSELIAFIRDRHRRNQ